jgi:anti-anti-sigma factor
MDVDHHQLDIAPSTDGDGRQVLVLAGDVDLKTVPSLSARVLGLARPGATVVLDLTDVRFVDSPGLGAIIHCHLRLTEDGATLVLRSPQPQVRELFDLVQLDSLLAIEPTG